MKVRESFEAVLNIFGKYYIIYKKFNFIRYEKGMVINMSETYVECLVARGISTGAKFVRILLVMLTAGFAILGLLGFPIPLLIALVLGIVTWFVYMRTDIEYEYLYLDKEIKVDMILNKSKRKKAAVYELDRMEIFAPVNSHHLDSYKNRQVKVADYSSREAKQPEVRYAFYYEGGQKVILEPNAEFIKAVQMVAPRKVFTD